MFTIKMAFLAEFSAANIIRVNTKVNYEVRYQQVLNFVPIFFVCWLRGNPGIGPNGDPKVLTIVTDSLPGVPHYQ